MSDNEVSTLLEILDLEYLKPILINRFPTIDQLASVNLHDIGIQNEDDRNKLRYALDELQQNPKSIEEYNPILSLQDSDQILTRIENEGNLIRSSLNLLFNNQKNSNLPVDDATFDLDYSIYNGDIDQIEADVENLDNCANNLVKEIERRFPEFQQRPSTNDDQSHLLKGTLLVLVFSVLSVGFIYYIKRK